MENKQVLNCRFEFLKDAFMKSGSGYKFVIDAPALSFRTKKIELKKQTKEKIIQRITKENTIKNCKKFQDGELSIELNFSFNFRYSIRDVDNIAKFVLDTMKDKTFRDDKQIKELILRKHRANKGAKEYIGIRIRKISGR